MPATIPLWIKLSYSLFVCVVVVRYWKAYGPTNFLYFCDVALLMAVPAVWWESGLLASAAAVGILMPQALWLVDFLCELVGFSLTGMTSYMFNPAIPLFTRLLSSFHLWLPFFLVWLVYRLGYDERALVLWSVLSCALLLVSYFLVPPPPPDPAHPARPVNVNYVYGLSDKKPQGMLPGWLYFVILMIFLPVGIYWPTHLLLSQVFSAPAQAESSSVSVWWGRHSCLPADKNVCPTDFPN